MPPPLAVIWRTWPQILSPFAIWAVLSWLQGGFSFRLIPPSSPVACQSQTDCLRSHHAIIYFTFTLIHVLVSGFVLLCVIWCHITVTMRTLLSYFVVTLLWLCALCCHIIIAVHILYIVSVRLIDTILSISQYCFQFHISFHTGE